MNELYLSRMIMPLELALQNGCRSCYDWHKFIWESLPERSEATRDFLFRVDVADRKVTVMLLSAVPPRVESRFETKKVADTFLSHPAYRFKVRANPTFRRNSDKRRIAIYREDELDKWFRRKLDAIGCAIVGQLSIDHPHDEIFTKDGKRGKHVSVDAEGIIKVKDAAAFAEGFRKGVGSAKGFGFGLIMLQPVQI